MINLLLLQYYQPLTLSKFVSRAPKAHVTGLKEGVFLSLHMCIKTHMDYHLPLGYQISRIYVKIFKFLENLSRLFKKHIKLWDERLHSNIQFKWYSDNAPVKFIVKWKFSVWLNFLHWFQRLSDRFSSTISLLSGESILIKDYSNKRTSDHLCY